MSNQPGGPELWSGQDPSPARPIPWSEIFQHHVSLIEGHIKMMDMVRKHTPEHSDNYTSVLEMVERARLMLVDTEKSRGTFMSSPDQPQKLPLGSPSIFQFPGHAPAGRKSGDSAKRHKASHHQDAKSNINRESHSAKLQEAKGQGQGNLATPHPSGTDGKQGINGATTTPMGGQVSSNGEAGLQDGAQPTVFVDTNPTPVDLSKLEIRSGAPTTAALLEEVDEDRKRKKPKKKHDGDLPLPPAETVDITKEVETRLKEKEEKKMRKLEKKRRRESEKSNGALSEATEEKVEVSDNAPEAKDTALDKPRKKKTKTKHTLASDQSPGQPQAKKRTGDDEHMAEDGEGKKKNRRKKLKTGKTRTSALS